MAVVIGLVVSLTRRHHVEPVASPPSSIVEDSPSQDPALSDMESAASLFDSTSLNTARSLLTNYSITMGSPRRWLGYAADFPGQVLLTAIWPSGAWMQENIDLAKGPDQYSFRNGSSYQLAGIDPSAFDLTGYECSVGQRGSVSVP